MLDVHHKPHRFIGVENEVVRIVGGIECETVQLLPPAAAPAVGLPDSDLMQRRHAQRRQGPVGRFRWRAGGGRDTGRAGQRSVQYFLKVQSAPSGRRRCDGCANHRPLGRRRSHFESGEGAEFSCPVAEGEIRPGIARRSIERNTVEQNGRWCGCRRRKAVAALKTLVGQPVGGILIEPAAEIDPGIVQIEPEDIEGIPIPRNKPGQMFGVACRPRLRVQIVHLNPSGRLLRISMLYKVAACSRPFDTVRRTVRRDMADHRLLRRPG